MQYLAARSTQPRRRACAVAAVMPAPSLPPTASATAAGVHRLGHPFFSKTKTAPCVLAAAPPGNNLSLDLHRLRRQTRVCRRRPLRRRPLRCRSLLWLLLLIRLSPPVSLFLSLFFPTACSLAEEGGKWKGGRGEGVWVDGDEFGRKWFGPGRVLWPTLEYPSALVAWGWQGVLTFRMGFSLIIYNRLDLNLLGFDIFWIYQFKTD